MTYEFIIAITYIAFFFCIVALFGRLIGWALGISEVRKSVDQNNRLLKDVIAELKGRDDKEN